MVSTSRTENPANGGRENQCPSAPFDTRRNSTHHGCLTAFEDCAWHKCAKEDSIPLVAIDSMVVDIIAERLDAGSLEGEYAESLQPHPSRLNGEAYAMYWLLALAPYWRSCVYTFSDTLYRELLKMPAEKRRRMVRLLGVAYEIREGHPGELLVVDKAQEPKPWQIVALGIADADAEHIADAIRLSASHFLTCDKRLLRKHKQVKEKWAIDLVSPSQFLVQAVRSGAPWPAAVRRPWEVERLAEPTSDD